MIENLLIQSVEQFPCYPGVEHEILPLCSNSTKLSVQSTRIGRLLLHRETFHGRVRYKEVQKGDMIYFGVFLPHVDSVKFLGSSFNKSFVVCWGGEERNEFDYVLEVGTQLYMLEMPLAVCRSRGWSLPSGAVLSVQQFKVAQFIAFADTIFEAAQCLGFQKLQTSEQFLMNQFEELVGDRLFRNVLGFKPSLAETKQRKLVSDTEAFLRTEATSTNTTGDEISQAMGVPRRTIYAAFKNQLGIGPSEFQRLVRVNQLRDSLLNTPYEKGIVSRLMLDVGLNHFGRASTMYRRHFGEMPIETVLRNSHKKS